MKTIFNYIAAFALLIGLYSCQNEWKQGSVSPSDMVEVTLNVQLPEPVAPATRGTMGEGALSTEPFEIYLCLYGSGDGYVQNWIPTTKVGSFTTNADGYITGGSFKVMLPLTNDPRTVHIIANPPADVNPTTSDYMDSVMERMVNNKGTDEECSYWQQIVLPNGIQATGYPDLQPDAALVSAFSDIHLVRNFAKVVVTDNSGVFSVTRWTLINVPDMGYVAPYNQNWKSEGWTNRFPQGYLEVENYTAPDAAVKLNDKLVADSYAGYMPPVATIDDSFPGNPDENAGKYAARGGAQYMYERPLPSTTAKQTAILVEVEFTAGNDPAGSTDAVKYWYKFELLDDKGEYMPVFRDVQYIVRLTEITAPGSATAQDAFNGSYFGNISASLETASLNELSNGKSLIHVDLMDYTFFTGNESVTLMKSDEEAAQYWFIPDENNPVIRYASVPGECDIKVELFSVDGYDASVTAIQTLSDGAIKVTLGSTGSSVKKSIIRVSGRRGDNVTSNIEKYIYREITVNLMETPSLVHGDNATRITNTPVVSSAGNEVDIDICLPEGLGSSIFPIQIRIEAEKNTLSATSSDLPVQTGKSHYDSNRNTFYYIYTINYSDYCWLDSETHKFRHKYEFPIKLYTNNSTDNSTKIYINDIAGFFHGTELILGTVTP